MFRLLAAIFRIQAVARVVPVITPMGCHFTPFMRGIIIQPITFVAMVAKPI